MADHHLRFNLAKTEVLYILSKSSLLQDLSLWLLAESSLRAHLSTAKSLGRCLITN
uniref:Uncharacterized protein n=1 Tax=Anguilla anguilla TaxID=7936 RepID=A0A0E9SGU7_ANGAN